MKGFAAGLALKQREKATRKWAIGSLMWIYFQENIYDIENIVITR